MNESSDRQNSRRRWLLAHLLDFHRREDKSVWWEFFRLARSAAEDYLDERRHWPSLLVRRAPVDERSAGVPVDRYRFRRRSARSARGESCTRRTDQKFGKVVRLDSGRSHRRREEARREQADDASVGGVRAQPS